MPALKLVDAHSRPAPYPADVSAKGWRFELDYERIEQSDTWALAEAEMRPWLLMLWLTAWKQRPCGSFPNEDALIAARIGMKLNTFKANRDVLLRGWSLADDGRIYHDTIVEQVASMLDKKTAERERKQRYREARAEQDVPRDTGGITLDGRGVPPVETLPEPTTGTVLQPQPLPPNAGQVTRTKPTRTLPCPHDAIVAAFHQILPTFPRVRVWQGKRRTALQKTWELDPKYQTIDFWKRFFVYVGQSTFLRGDAAVRDGAKEPFRADLEWLVNLNNFSKVIEGKYQDKDDDGSSQADDGEAKA